MLFRSPPPVRFPADTRLARLFAVLAALSACEGAPLLLPAEPDVTAPRIDAIEPSAALGGQVVTLRGAALRAAGTSTVTFTGGAQGRVTGASDDGRSLLVEVPADARDGAVTVVVDDRTASGGLFHALGAGAPRFRTLTRKTDLRPGLNPLSVGPDHVFLQGEWFATSVTTRVDEGFLGTLTRATGAFADGISLFAMQPEPACDAPDAGRISNWDDGRHLDTEPDRSWCVPELRKFGRMRLRLPGERFVLGPDRDGVFTVVTLPPGGTPSVQALDTNDPLEAVCTTGNGRLVATRRGGLRIWDDVANPGRDVDLALMNVDGDAAHGPWTVGCDGDTVALPLSESIVVVKLDSALEVVSEASVPMPFGSSVDLDFAEHSLLDAANNQYVVVARPHVASFALPSGAGPGGLRGVVSLDQPFGVVPAGDGAVVVGIRGGFVRLDQATLAVRDQGRLRHLLSGPHFIAREGAEPLVAVLDLEAASATVLDPRTLENLGQSRLADHAFETAASSVDGRLFSAHVLDDYESEDLGLHAPTAGSCTLEGTTFDEFALSPHGRWLSWVDTLMERDGIGFIDADAPLCSEDARGFIPTEAIFASLAQRPTDSRIVVFDDVTREVAGYDPVRVLAGDTTPAWHRPFALRTPIAWSIDVVGDLLAVSGFGRLELIDALTGDAVRVLEYPRDLAMVALSPNAREVWIADGTTLLVLIEDGADSWTVAATVEMGVWIEAMRFSPGGDRLYVLTRDEQVSAIE